MRVLRALAVLAILIAGCGDGPKQLTVFHTNDVHAQFSPSEAGWLPENPLVGGYEALYAALNEERRSTVASILLDAGDLLTGTPVSDMPWSGARGGHLIRFMNLLGFDAMAIGNHDLDLSITNLHAMARIAQFPLLAANLCDSGGKPLIGDGWTLMKRGNLRIAVIGLVTDYLLGVSSAQVATQVLVKNSIVVCDSLARVLDSESDVIIVLSHCGHSADRRLAEALGSRIDVIVGGHSHDRIDPPEMINDVIIVQAGAKLRYLGRLDLTIENDEVIQHSGGLRLLDCKILNTSMEGNTVSKLGDSLDVVVESTYGDTIGYVVLDMVRAYYRESSVGNWVADVIREYTGADVAFINSGGMRSDLSRGPITRRTIMELLPMANSVAVFSCSGGQVKRILEHNLTAAVKETHGILQQSGINCSYHVNADGHPEIDSVRIGDTEIDEAKQYECATVDFVALSNPGKYLGFDPGHVYDYQIAVSELAVRSVLRSGKIESAVDGRIVELPGD